MWFQRACLEQLLVLMQRLTADHLQPVGLLPHAVLETRRALSHVRLLRCLASMAQHWHPLPQLTQLQQQMRQALRCLLGWQQQALPQKRPRQYLQHQGYWFRLSKLRQRVLSQSQANLCRSSIQDHLTPA
jgi:hypothetical protein